MIDIKAVVMFFVRIKELAYFVFVRAPMSLLGRVKGNLVFVHWGRGKNNFGDCLSPDILRYYGMTPVYVPQRKSEIVLAGTILQWLPAGYKGLILGTGGDCQRYFFPNALVIGVRGFKTLENFQNDTKVGVVGDPGLIICNVFPDIVEKKYKLGVVPHFVDKDHEIIKRWKSAFGVDCLFIDVLRSPRDVITDIKSCDFILSSSLHGLITADSFNIPNARFVIRDTMPDYFYDYKFDDYYSSLNSVDQPLEVNGQESMADLISKTRLHIEGVDALKHKLENEFLHVLDTIKKRRNFK